MNNQKRSDHQDTPCNPCEAYGKRPSACAKALDYVSEEELEILSELRAVKERARSLRAKVIEEMAAGSGGGDGESLVHGFQRVMTEMEGLRTAWRDLKARLEEANARKLTRLGHGP